jgi:hypothetical protein
MKKLVVIVLALVFLGLLSTYPSEVLSTVVGVLLVWLPVRIAGLAGQRLGACVDAEIDRRRRQDQLVRLLLRERDR